MSSARRESSPSAPVINRGDLRAHLLISLFLFNFFWTMPCPAEPLPQGTAIFPVQGEWTQGHPVISAILPNGMRVVAQEEKSDMNVSIRIMARIRGIDSEVQAAAAVMLERLLLCGATSKLDREESSRLLAVLGGTGQSRTTSGYSTLCLTVPASFFPRALDLIASWTGDPIFDQEDVFRERERLIREVGSMGKEPLFSAVRAITGWWTGSTGGSERLQPLGADSLNPYLRPSAIEKVTQAELKELHSRLWVPSNMVLLVSGNVNSKVCLSGAQAVFSPYGGDPVLSVARVADKSDIQSAIARLAPKCQSSSPLRVIDQGPARVMVIWPTVSFSDTRAPVLDLISEILGDSEKSPIAPSVTALSHTPLGRTGIFALSQPAGEAKGKALKELCLELEKGLRALPEQNFSASLKRARKSIVTRYSQVFRGDRNTRLEMMGLELLSGQDPQGGQSYLTALQGVTEDRLRDVMRQLLDPSGAVFCVIGTEDIIEQSAGKTSDVTTALDWKPGVGKSRVYSWGGKCVMDLIPGQGSLRIVASFPCSPRVEDENSRGFSNIIGEIISNRISEKRDSNGRLPIRQIHALNFRQCPDAMHITIECDNESGDRAFDLLVAILKDKPSAKEVQNALERLNSEGNQPLWNPCGAENQSADPGREEFMHQLWSNFFRSHPYGGMGRWVSPGSSWESLSEGGVDLTAATDEFWTRWLNSSVMSIVLWGAGNPEDLSEKINASMAPLAGARNPIPAYPSTFAFSEADEEIRLPAVQESGATLVGVAYSAPFIGDREYFAMKVLAAFLEEYSSGDVIMEGLLADASEGLKTGVVSGPDAGIYYLIAAVRPGAGSDAAGRIAQYCSDLSERVIPENELDMARCRAISMELAAFSDPMDRFMRMSSALLFDVCDDYFRWFSEGVGRVTAVDVREAARNYCRRRLVLLQGDTEKRETSERSGAAETGSATTESRLSE